MKKIRKNFGTKMRGAALRWGVYGWDAAEKEHGNRYVTITRAYKVSNYYLDLPYSLPQTERGDNL